jgi:Orotidine 5'-phosphate decarboxylase / HUMPS family
MRQVGPHICVLKTHVDLHTDFSEDFVQQLQALAEKHGGCLRSPCIHISVHSGWNSNTRLSWRCTVPMNCSDNAGLQF